jgi:hypothetical protein
MRLAAVDRKLENNQDYADVYVSLIRTSYRLEVKIIINLDNSNVTVCPRIYFNVILHSSRSTASLFASCFNTRIQYEFPILWNSLSQRP